MISMKTETKTAVLITAATRWEAAPLARGLGLRSSAANRFEGRAGARPVVLVKTGIGATKTTEALERGCVAGDFGLALSVGLCGALQPELKTGDLVADAQNADMDYVTPLRETAVSLGLPLHFGKILHANILLRPEDKRRLGVELRTVACDMETAAVRRWAYDKIPVIGLRAVLDEVDEELPDSPAGEDAAALARYALSHAGQMPRLIRLGLRSSRAMRVLARFLKIYLEAV